MRKVFLDVECYKNYFLICFKGGNKIRSYELHDTESLNKTEINKIMTKYLTVGFNSNYYDLPMINAALNGRNNKELKYISDAIINSENYEVYWKLLKYWNIYPPNWSHIDIKNVALKVRSIFPVSLKMYGARMHLKTIQDLPIEENELIDEIDRELLRKYCINDIDTTIALYNTLEDEINLRNNISKEYKIDVRSKSRAQIAEAVIKKELNLKQTRFDVLQHGIYKYEAPEYIKFISDELNGLLEEIQNISFACDDKGKLQNPEVLQNKEIKINNSVYQLGIGGLHSTEKNKNTITKWDEILVDLDVTSYYPSIILNNKLYPVHLGESFLNLYRSLYNKRLNAKKSGDKVTSECYKIILNGVFGKFGSRYSCLYSPSLLLNTTLTGQLAIIMLIEAFHAAGIETVSTNTDGIVIKHKLIDSDKYLKIKTDWETKTNLSLDATMYEAIFSDSVNSYIAITPEGKVKLKGAFGERSIHKNPVAEITTEAVIDFITKNIPIKETIRACKDITKFIIVRAVKGGGAWKDQFLGKTVRWIYGINGEPIKSKISGNKVAGSDKAIPIMTLPDQFPDYINYEIYYDISFKMLKRLGVNA